MKPFDTKGEYSPEEVKAALAGIDGTRQLSFRYERLTRNNQFVEDIDYVQSFKIENNALADIKRTAKIDILDTGTINYLHDRIKPYIQLAMPADKDYDDSVRALDPDIWWKMDDEKPAPAVFSASGLADAMDYNTRETAYVMTATPETEFRRSAYILQGSPTLRSEYWTVSEITDSTAFSVGVMSFSHPGMGFEIYFSKESDGELELVFPVAGDNPFDDYTGTSTYSFAFPRHGFYYTRTFTTATVTKQFMAVTISRPARLEDSSGNGIYATGLNLDLRAASLIGKGYAMQSVDYGQNLWNADGIHLTHDGAVVSNFWMNVPDTNSDDVSVDLSFSTPDEFDWSTGISINYWSPNDFVTAAMSTWGWYGALDFPVAKMYGTHMYSFYYYPDQGKASFYLDGAYVGEFIDDTTPVSEGVYDFATAPIISASGSMSAGDSMTVDDVTVYLKPIPVTSLMDIYRDGIGAMDNTRSGYVEWPQGVFVLSSPTRTMKDGNTITREVEGYDQLVILKEDSFDYRYSVPVGAKYTEALFKVLQSTKPKVQFPFNEVYWTSSTEGVSINSESSIWLTQPSDLGSNAAIWSGGGQTLKDIYVSAKIDGPTSPSTSITQMVVKYMTNDGVIQTITMSAEGSTIYCLDQQNASVSVARNVVTHAYWRMRESGGYFYWETSPDNKVWTQIRKMKLTIDTYTNIGIQFTADHQTAGMMSGFHQVVVEGYGMVDADIVKSATKLPTAMEWEPGTPKLTIVNDILSAINYESATYDENGVFIGRPYVSPQNRTSAFRYATDSESVITGDIDQSVDVFSVPNKWVVVVSDPDRPMLVGEYTNDDPHSPTSTVSRGRTIVDYRTEQSAPNQLTLDAQAARLAFEASQVYESIEFDTALMPIHQTADVYDVAIDGLSISSKYSETSWSMELKNGAIMSHKIRRIVSV